MDEEQAGEDDFVKIIFITRNEISSSKSFQI